MRFRTAKESDIPELLGLAADFVHESDYPWDFSAGIAFETFQNYIASDESDVFVIDTDKRAEVGLDVVIAAWAMAAFDRDFCHQRIGYLSKFYVSTEFRGSVAARKLLQGVDEWFREKDCWTAFATATANISALQDKQFENLFRKFDYQVLGPTMKKDFTDV